MSYNLFTFNKIYLVLWHYDRYIWTITGSFDRFDYLNLKRRERKKEGSGKLKNRFAEEKKFHLLGHHTLLSTLFSKFHPISSFTWVLSRFLHDTTRGAIVGNAIGFPGFIGFACAKFELAHSSGPYRVMGAVPRLYQIPASLSHSWTRSQIFIRGNGPTLLNGTSTCLNT